MSSSSSVKPETLKRSALMAYGKPFLAKKHYEIERRCGLPPALVTCLYQVIIEELGECLDQLSHIRNIEEEEIYVRLYVSPVLPKSLVNVVEKCAKRKRVERATRYAWIKLKDTKKFHFLLFEMKHNFEMFSKCYEERGKWRAPLVYPNLDNKDILSKAWQIYAMFQTGKQYIRFSSKGPMSLTAFCRLSYNPRLNDNTIFD